MDYHVVTLETLNSGAVIDLFGNEWNRMLENIQDENTRPDAVRRVKIEVIVKPDKDRNHATTKVAVTSKLEPNQPHESFIVLGGEHGRLQAYTTDPRQQELGDDLGINIGSSVTAFKKEAK
jgi:hypothetical protein